jgi:hypothetical protein
MTDVDDSKCRTVTSTELIVSAAAGPELCAPKDDSSRVAVADRVVDVHVA